jgi:hypothetical protein
MSKDNETQNDKILSYLEEGNSISPMDALNQFGCFRLASRIHELRTYGYAIETIRIGGRKYAEYKLADAGVDASTSTV